MGSGSRRLAQAELAGEALHLTLIAGIMAQLDPHGSDPPRR
jgi:hypothetical protein